jgi:hypothetical protein
MTLIQQPSLIKREKALSIRVSEQEEQILVQLSRSLNMPVATLARSFMFQAIEIYLRETQGVEQLTSQEEASL